MYVVEKIGQLILVTLEGHVTKKETKAVKSQIKNLAEKEDEVVVSFDIANLDISEKSLVDKSSYNEIIEYCVQSNIRIYSYFYDE